MKTIACHVYNKILYGLLQGVNNNLENVCIINVSEKGHNTKTFVQYYYNSLEIYV